MTVETTTPRRPGLLSDEMSASLVKICCDPITGFRYEGVLLRWADAVFSLPDCSIPLAFVQPRFDPKQLQAEMEKSHFD